MMEERPAYISIEDIPRSGVIPPDAHPYEEWERDIPEGKALEITDRINGRKPKHVRATIAAALKRKGLLIVVINRKDRLFIAKPGVEQA